MSNKRKLSQPEARDSAEQKETRLVTQEYDDSGDDDSSDSEGEPKRKKKTQKTTSATVANRTTSSSDASTSSLFWSLNTMEKNLPWRLVVAIDDDKIPKAAMSSKPAKCDFLCSWSAVWLLSEKDSNERNT